MPTARPRIAVTLTEEQAQLLRRLKQLNGLSMSETVGDLIDAAAPILARTAHILELAAAAPDATKRELRAMLESAEARILPEVERLAAETAAVCSDVAKAAADAQGTVGPQGRTAPERNPRPSNTGVRSQRSRRH